MSEKKELFLVKENEVYKREREKKYSLEEIITFKLPVESIIVKQSQNWYLTVALEKSDKVKKDREQLTRQFMMAYSWAIRKGFNHELDPHLKERYSYPRNRNTIKGIQSYIDRIKKQYHEMMKSIEES